MKLMGVYYCKPKLYNPLRRFSHNAFLVVYSRRRFPRRSNPKTARAAYLQREVWLYNAG
jgi:hypothetical protein